MKSKKTKKLFTTTFFLLAISFLACFAFANAADQTSVGQAFSFPWSNATGLGALVKQIYLIALGIVGMLAFGMIVFGGIQYSISSGDPSRQKDARDRITQALWGVVLLLAAFLILNTINPDLIKLKDPVLGTITAAPTSTAPIIDPNNLPTSLTEQQMRDKLASWGITVWESCPGCTKTSCLRQDTINELGALARHCQNALHPTRNCLIRLTGGCEQGHSTQGYMNHANGYKVDLQPATAGSELFTYILQYCKELPRPQSGSVYIARYNNCEFSSAAGTIYNLEKQTSTGGVHWDVVVP